MTASRFDNFKFFPRDWFGEQGLRKCSLTARGLWIDMLCLMHEAEPYGHLTHRINRQPISPEELTKFVGKGEDVKKVITLLDELRKNGVFSETEEGVIYSRRLVRDHKKRTDGSRGGKAGGGSPLLASGTLKSDFKDEKDASRAREEDSSLDSSSLSDSVFKTDSSEEEESSTKGKPARGRTRNKTLLPVDTNFVPPKEEWAKALEIEEGVNEKFLNWQTEKFIDYWTERAENGERLAFKSTTGWVSAWRNWIKNSVFRYGEFASFRANGTGTDRRGTDREAGGRKKPSRAERYRKIKPLNTDEE